MRRRRMFLTPRWLGLHALTVVITVTFVALGWWQFRRGEEGNLRSYAYALQWPTFALFVVFMWVTLIRHERMPPTSDTPGVESGPDGAAGADPPPVSGPETPSGSPDGAGTTARPAAGPASRMAGAARVTHQAPSTRPARPARPGGPPAVPSPSAAGGREETTLPRVARRRRVAADPTVSSAADPPTAEEPDEELAAYNRYLARLNADADRRQW